MAIGLGEKIFKLRVAGKIHQSELCKLLDVSQSRLSYWENGVGVPPSEAMRKLIKLGEKYNIVFTIDDVLRKSPAKRIDKGIIKKSKK